jgi:N-acetylmuramoyl-L-alanine amidase
MKILIDPGHGIDTPGKRSPDFKFREYLFNRQVSDLLLPRLRGRGLDADLVVTETNDISLETRARRVNKVCDRYGAGNVILLSIHANAAGLGDDWMTASGWEVYTTKGETRADLLAECLHIAFAKTFPEKKMRGDWSDGDADKERDFYIIKKTRCPAVLLENFFYDNREECAWLLKEETRRRIADAIVDGVLLYLGMI